MLTISTILKKANASTLIKANIYVVLIASLVSCQPIILSRGTVTPSASTPDVQVTLLPPMTIAPTRACMSVPGIKLDAVPLSSSSIRAKITGLNPNEHVIFVFYSEMAGQTFKIESSPPEGADENGSIEYTEGGLDQTSGVHFKEWQVQVIHSRGVTCTTISIP